MMYSIISDLELLEKAENEDIDALSKLDKAGFIISSSESPKDYVARIRLFAEKLTKLEESLEKTGEYELEEIHFSKTDKIPKSIFVEANDFCRKIYDFNIDWVPGFFVNPSFGILFGGCAFCYFPEFFALFIIRKSFKSSTKWLIYDRNELMSHELCHIARIALDSNIYEETFAYQTSSSFLRKTIGGIFLKQKDSLMFIGSVFLLLFAQIARVFLLPAIPIVIFWTIPLIIVLWLSIRYFGIKKRLSKANNNLKTYFGIKSKCVLFRCSDNDINELANLKENEIKTYIDSKKSINWQVIKNRFL